MLEEPIKTHKTHRGIADALVKKLLPGIMDSFSKYVIAIAGESGSGKTVITELVRDKLNALGVKTIIIQQDDYFRHPPMTNYDLRRRDLSIVGTSEIKSSLINKHVKLFKTPGVTHIKKPLIDFKNNRILSERINCGTARVMIVEGTYVSTVKHTDVRIFLARTFRETLQGRIKRRRDKLDALDRKILMIEHRIISKHSKFADLVIEKNKTITDRLNGNREIKRICMITIHGYVDPHPTLGKTDTGGQVTYVLELSKALAKKGLKVDIFTRKFHHKKNIEIVNRNVRIIRIPCGGNDFIPKERIFPHLPTFIKNMEKFIRKEKIKYDIYHSHYWDAGYVAMKLTQRKKYFFVHTFHSLGAWKKERMGGKTGEMERLYKFRERIRNEKNIFRKTRSLVMTSSEMLNISKKFYRYTGNNFLILPAGVNTSFFRPLRKNEKEKNIDVPQNYIFWVGRFDTNKGLDSLLNAFALVVNRAKDLFLIIGGGSKYPRIKEKRLIKELQRIIEKNHITSRVFFTRHIKDKLMPTYYRKARFFVLPSRFEPFGMTSAEAMSSGTPVIISNNAGVRRYLKNGHNCMIVNCSNRKELAEAFLTLDKNTTLRRHLSKNGLKIAREKFSWTNIAEKLIKHYTRLVRSPE